MHVVNRLLREGTVRDVEVLYRCKDGTQRVGLATAEIIEIEDERCVLSVIADITDRKRAEEALVTMGRRLIEAQEQERSRIGRELHDDINQQLGLVSIELDQCSHTNLIDNIEIAERLDHAKQHLFKIAKDVQALSHRLHSSKLDYLGLVTAAKSFCKEVSERSNVEVAFRDSGVPTDIAKEQSLSVFRVLQEALHNAIKYSQVRKFNVDLIGTAQYIELTVVDTGVGFDEQEAFTRQGLGLISMRERVQMVGGEFAVRSRPGVGTTIYARVPLTSQISAMAG